MEFVNFETGELLIKIDFNEKCLESPSIKIYDTSALERVIDWIAEHFNVHITIVPFASFTSLNKIAYVWQYKYDSDGSDIKTTESEFSYINKNECKKDAILSTLKFILDNPEKFNIKS